MATVVCPKFMAEDEVRQLEDNGPYATEMREAITGVSGQLVDAQLAARKDAELILGYVESSNDWLMNHISIIHQCGEFLQEGVGDVAALTTRYAYPTLSNGVSNLLGRMEDFCSSVVTQVDELIEDVCWNPRKWVRT